MHHAAMLSRDPAVLPEHFASFGALLRHLRLRANLTLRDLAIAVNYSEGYLSRLESDQRRPNPAVVRARFFPALGLLHDPSWATRLLELAADTRPAELSPAATPPARPPAHPPHILATRLYVPRPQPGTLVRQRLLDQLDRALALPLTLVVAPAGAGKTTLLATWLHHFGLPIDDVGLAEPSGNLKSKIQNLTFAWLSLEPSDDLSAALRYLVAALHTFVPGAGAATLALLNAAAPPPIPALLTPLLNDLAALDGEAVLVLDDYHVLTDAAAHAAVTFLAEHLPPQLHLVLATREEPPLPLPRLRARRALVEIRAADLRFSPPEAHALLGGALGVAVSADEATALTERTEGWAAGLQLAALALRAHADRSGFIADVVGSQRFIADYLASEVLDQLPAHLRRFLLETAVLDRLCGPLCDAVVGIENAELRIEKPDHNHADSQCSMLNAQFAPSAYSQLLLDEIERRNLFVVPLDDARGWYRYHHLFAAMLRAELARGTNVAHVAALHRRAGRWFAQHDLPDEAIRHALAAGDTAEAALIVERRAETLLEGGQLVTMQRLLGLLPDTLLAQRPQLCLAQAVCITFSGADARGVEPLLRAAEKAGSEAAHGGAASWLADTTGVALLVRCSFALVLRTIDPLPELIAQLRERLPQMAPFLQAWTRCAFVLVHVQRNDLVAANAAFAATQGDENGYASRFQLQVAHDIGQVYLRRGMLRAAQQLFHRVLRQAERGRSAPTTQAGLLHISLARIAYEQNALDIAHKHAQSALALGKAIASATLLLLGNVWLAVTQQARGVPAEAQAALEEAEALAAALPPWQGPHLFDYGYVFYLFLGKDLRASAGWVAERHVQRVADEPLLRDAREVIVATVALGRHDAARAEQVIEPALAAAVAGERQLTATRLLVLRALAQIARGERAGAHDAMRQAVALAAGEHYARAFIDAGAPVATLLNELSRQPLEPQLHAFVATLLAAFGVAPISPPPASALPPLSSLIEPLNERERAVLRLIADGHSNAEIAARLIVALSTVKWHTANLYGKLGVKTRTQALARAAELGLL